MSITEEIIYNCQCTIMKTEKILNTMNTNHCQYPNCCLSLWVCIYVEIVEVVEVMYWMINCHFAYARSSCTWSYPLLHGLYLLHPLLLLPFVPLIQLYVPPINLLKLLLH